MPLIDDDEFLKMCNELDRLKENEKDLKKGYIDLKLENNKINNYKNKRSIVILLLITVALVLIGYLYKRQIEITTVKEQKYKLENLLNNTSKEEVKEEPLFIESVVFSVQIEGLNDFNIIDENAVTPWKIRKLPDDTVIKSNTYIAGEFNTYDKARIFRDKIKKIGIKNVLVIALYEGEKISLSKALKLLEN